MINSPLSFSPFLECSFIGATQQLAFTGVSGRVQLDGVAKSVPAKFILRSDEDVRIRQGGSAVVAAQTDFLLKANAYLVITIVDTNNNYIAAITPTGGTDSTLDCTILSDATPGS